MIYLIIPAALAPLAPGFIKALGGVGAFIASKLAVKYQNKYNSPGEQVARLREAGIPLAASKYFENVQKSLPDTSGIQMAGTHLGDYVTTTKHLKDIELLKEVIDKAKSDAGIASNLLQLSNDDLTYWLDQGVKLPSGESYSMNNFRKHLETVNKEVQNLIQGHEKEIKSVDEAIKKATQESEIQKVKEQVTDIISGYLLKNNIRINNEQIQIAAHTIINHMKKGGLSFIEAITLNQLLSIGARINVPGVQLGSQ